MQKKQKKIIFEKSDSIFRDLRVISCITLLLGDISYVICHITVCILRVKMVIIWKEHSHWLSYSLKWIGAEPGDFDIQGGTRNRTHRHIHFDSWSLCISVWITRYSESLSQVIMKRSDSIHFMDYNMGLSITDEWMRWEISIMWIERSKGRKRDGEGEWKTTV